MANHLIDLSDIDAKCANLKNRRTFGSLDSINYPFAPSKTT
jgi:hypothetical protein